MTVKKQPFGTWTSPISANADSYRFAGMAWDARTHTLLWQERRPAGSALVAFEGHSVPRDVLRSAQISGRVGYGGGGFTAADSTVYFVGTGGRLYRMNMDTRDIRAITPEFGGAAGPVVSPNGRWVAYVHTYENRDCVAVVASDGSSWPVKLLDDSDFVMQLAWHPAGDRLACVTWNHPNMPWDSAELRLLYLTSGNPGVMGRQKLAGGPDIAAFGPVFSPDGHYLAYASDETGWWQVYVYDFEAETHQQLTHDEAEYAIPAWQQATSTLGWAHDSASLFAIRNAESSQTLVRIDIESGTSQTIHALNRYTYFEQLAVAPTDSTVAVYASNPTTPTRIVTYEPDSERLRTAAHASTEPRHTHAKPQPHTWQADDGTPIHGIYYPPTNPDFEANGLPPVIIKIHGGPTGQVFFTYDHEAQFFATRGFGVLQVNYRGSTGYGRAFRNKLRGQWGVLEVEDAASGAQYLLDQGIADSGKRIIMGSSSGGYAVLQSLIRYPGLYRAGIARAPISDLFALGAQTHKFEAHYNDLLLGVLPDATPIFKDRSPIFHLDRIQDPLALFHGLADPVVHPRQSEVVAESLKRRGIPHIIKLYEGEGHSFRKPETRADYYDQILAFLGQHVVYSS